MGSVRILLADDHTLVCEALKKLLEPEYEVVAMVGNGRDLLDLAARLKPDVVLLDIGMPTLNGIDAARLLRRQRRDVKIVCVTMNRDVDIALEALRAGAAAYVLKNCAGSELKKAIQDVLKGERYVTAEIRQRMSEIVVQDPGSVRRDKVLSQRQREVLQLLAEGYSMKQVAAALHVKARTVAFHKYRIMGELNIKTNAELVQYAMRRGMLVADGR